MNNIVLNVYRPKLRNLFWGLGFLSAFAASVVAVVFGAGLPRETVLEKTVNCIAFALSWVISVFMLAGTVNCFRNIFSGPSVVLTNERLSVQRKGEMSVCDIDKEKISVQKNKVVFEDKNGNRITVKKSMISIPVGTLAYAVGLRIDQISE